MLRSNSQLASLIADAGLVGTKSRKGNESLARNDASQSSGNYGQTPPASSPAQASPSLYEFNAPPTKRSINRASSARPTMPVPRSNHSYPAQSPTSSAIPPIHRAISSKSPPVSRGASAVTHLPPAFSVSEEPSELLPPKRSSDPAVVYPLFQPILGPQPSPSHAWTSEPSHLSTMDQSLPRPLVDALNAAAKATEGAARILTHGGPDTILLQPIDNSLMNLVTELRGQLLAQAEDSMSFKIEGGKREQALTEALMKLQTEKNKLDHELCLIRSQELSKYQIIDARLEEMTKQLAAAKQDHASEIERLSKDLSQSPRSEKDSGMKGLKAIKAAEEKLEKSEANRRNAERKMIGLEQDLLMVRSLLDTKSKESSDLAALLSVEKTLAQQLRQEMDAKVKSGIEVAQVKKQLQMIEAEKKFLEMAKDKMELDLGKRTQTLLSAQADSDAMKATLKNQEATIAQLIIEKDGLQEKIVQLQSVAIPQIEGRSLVVALPGAQSAVAQAKESATEGDRPWVTKVESSKTPPRHPSSSSGASQRPVTASPSSQPHVNPDMVKVQRMLMDTKEEYAHRLVYIEGELQKAETSAQTYSSQLDRMASALAARTAILLKSRLLSNQALISHPPPSSASSVNGDEMEGSRMRSGRSNESKGQVSKSVLQQMNEKLVSENAALLVEVARLQSSQVKLKVSKATSDGTPPLGLPSSQNIAQDALSAVVKEALLSTRNKSLNAVMTMEGWEGSNNQTFQTKSPADAALNAAEDDLRSRASSLSLQSQLRALKMDLHEAGTRLSAQAHVESELQQIKKELAAAEARIRSLETDSRVVRTGMMRHDDDASVASLSLRGDRMEEKMRSAKDEVNRHKLLASAAQREKDVIDQELEDSKRKIQKLEGQLRELRNDSSKSDEANKRLRSILMQARAQMKEAGIEFLDDAAYDSVGGGRGSVRSSEAGSVVRQSSDGTLFKALDQREKERDMQRMQREVNEAQYQANLVSKDLKKTKSQLTQAQSELQKEREGREREIEALASESARLSAKVKALEIEALASESRCAESKKELEASKCKVAKMTLDLGYLRERSTQARPKPKLSYAVALNLSVA